eukprot:5360900-Alexandrium_andersonii.AAC.1
MEHCLAGNPGASIPGAKGAVVPLVDWKSSYDFLALFRARGPFIALDDRKLFCIVRTPESQRKQGASVDR